MGKYALIISGLLLLGPATVQGQLEAWDSDQDAMPNGWEFHRSLDVNDPTDAWLDPDQDGICNLYEYLLGTDPQDNSQPRFVNYTGEQSLSQTIKGAGRGVVLRIPEGYYPLNYQHESLADPPRIMVQGGWNKGFTERDYCRYSTVLDGNAQGAIFNFLIASGNSSTLIIDGCTLSGGTSGAVRYTSYLAKAQLALVNCRIESNSAHRADAMITFEDSESTLISDLLLINTTLNHNYGTGVIARQAANHTNLKLLHSLIAFNDFANNDGPPYTSGHGLDLLPKTDSSFHIQLTNSIFWENAGTDIRLNLSQTLQLAPDIEHNIYDFLESPVQSALFSHPSNRSINPLLNRTDDHQLLIDPASPALAAGTDLGLGSTDIGPRFCEVSLPTPTSTAKMDAAWILFPNPAEQVVLIRGMLPDAGSVRLVLYNAVGQRLREQHRGEFAAGALSLRVRTAALNRGMYFLEIQIGDRRQRFPFVKR